MLKIFKIVALLEGVSYILLFSNMLFIKPNNFDLYKILLFPIGMAHGVLFISYIYLAFFNKAKQNWDWTTLGIILLGSLIPFGTFYIDKKYLNA